MANCGSRDAYCRKKYSEEVVLSTLPGFYMSVDRFCQHNSITGMQKEVTKPYSCVVEINMTEFEEVKTDFEDWCHPG